MSEDTDLFPVPHAGLRLFEGIRGTLARLRDDDRGGSAILFAAATPLLVGMIGLAVDVGYWYAEKRALQGVSDAVAVAAAFELASGGDSAAIEAVATYEADRNGYEMEEGTLSVVTPPSSGTYAGVETAVQVTLSQPGETFFSALFLDDGPTIQVTAVGGQMETGEGGVGECILALDSNDASAMKVSGTVDMDLDCGISVLSSDDKAFKFSGSGSIDAPGICVAGGAYVTGTVNFGDAEPTENCSGPSDPLANLAAPAEASGACDETNWKASGARKSLTLSPGTYCGGIKISGSSHTITFDPGVYVLAGGGLSVSGSGTVLNGSDVLFYNTDNAGDGDFDQIKFSGSNTFNLSGRESGDYAGILIFHDRDDSVESSSKTFTVSGTTTVNLDGVVYVPTQNIDFSGTTGGGLGCSAKLIGRTIEFTGTSAAFSTGEGCVSESVTWTTSGGDTRITVVE